MRYILFLYSLCCICIFFSIRSLCSCFFTPLCSLYFGFFYSLCLSFSLHPCQTCAIDHHNRSLLVQLLYTIFWPERADEWAKIKHARFLLRTTCPLFHNPCPCTSHQSGNQNPSFHPNVNESPVGQGFYHKAIASIYIISY